MLVGWTARLMIKISDMVDKILGNTIIRLAYQTKLELPSPHPRCSNLLIYRHLSPGTRDFCKPLITSVWSVLSFWCLPVQMTIHHKKTLTHQDRNIKQHIDHIWPLIHHQENTTPCPHTTLMQHWMAPFWHQGLGSFCRQFWVLGRTVFNDTSWTNRLISEVCNILWGRFWFPFWLNIFRSVGWRQTICRLGSRTLFTFHFNVTILLWLMLLILKSHINRQNTQLYTQLRVLYP